MPDGIRGVARLPSIRRLPDYLRVLRAMQSEGCKTVSTTHLSHELGIGPIVVRKDLAFTGATGRPRVGYRLDKLIHSIETFLGWNNVTDMFLVGVGHLGMALLGYESIERHGYRIVAGFDSDPAKVGLTIHGRDVFPMENLHDLASRLHVHLGILAVPSTVAQAIAQEMVAAGICAIWNFTPVPLDLGDDVVVQQEDLTRGLAVLSVKLGNLFKSANRQGAPS